MKSWTSVNLYNNCQKLFTHSFIHFSCLYIYMNHRRQCLRWQVHMLFKMLVMIEIKFPNRYWRTIACQSRKQDFSMAITWLLSLLSNANPNIVMQWAYNYAAPKAWVSVWIKRWTRKFAKQIQNRQNILDAYLLWFRVLLFFLMSSSYLLIQSAAMPCSWTVLVTFLYTRGEMVLILIFLWIWMWMWVRALVHSFTHFRVCVCVYIFDLDFRFVCQSLNKPLFPLVIQ